MPIDLPRSPALTAREYELFRRLIYARSGIDLGPAKHHLVRARLGKRLRTGNFTSFKQYYDHVLDDKTGQELAWLLNAISTNTTRFFREPRHFELLAKTIEERITAAGRTPWEIRIWSAACSTGEEPYSIAMTVDDLIRPHPHVRLKLLATDLSTNALSEARPGVYPASRLGALPPGFAETYFRPASDSDADLVQVVPEIRSLVTFARFNLMQEDFGFRRPFDAIFCRNAMIYFDHPTQQALVEKFYEHLTPGGLLLIGHSESLTGLQHSYELIAPATYRKPHHAPTAPTR